ncbi:MAG: choice-of-anchor Q domain-containing protein, partial [Cyanobacteria bacterium J06598_3]
MQGTIIAANSADYGPDFVGSFTSLGNNIIQTRQGSSGYGASDLREGTDPLLSPLADNGGPTFTHALLPGSPAIDAGSNNINGRDQRGTSLNGIPDIGAYESTLNQIANALAFTAGGAQSTVVGTPFSIPLQAQVTNALGNGLPGISVRYYRAPGIVWDENNSQVIFTGVTDANGQVSTSLVASTLAGIYTVRAETTSGLFDDTVMTKLPDVASNLEVVSGDNQTTEVSTAFATPLTVQVTDQYDNAIAQEAITFVTPSAGASSVLDTTRLVTNTLGQATTTAIANNITGTYSIAATTAGLANQFTLTNTPALDPTVNPSTPFEEIDRPGSTALFSIDPTQRSSGTDSSLSDMLDSEEQQQHEGRVNFFDGVAFSQVERSLTEEYAKYWQKPLEGETSFEEIQQLLQNAEEHHQSKSAVVYALFVPSSERTALADNRYPSVLSQRLLRNDVNNEQDQLLLMLIGPN